MHTNYHKISARERDTAPRYYYKRTRTLTCCERLKNFLRAIFAFFFTQIGVCALVAVYMVLGAYVFSSLEAESQMECAEVAETQRQEFAKHLWNITLNTNVLFKPNWRNETDELVHAFQNATGNYEFYAKCNSISDTYNVQNFRLQNVLCSYVIIS